tara:strand:- start:85 stop:243 length:159 start_codon:yes stop_codon:yes gene_type:complete
MSQQSSEAPAFVTSLTPEPDIKDPVDTSPSDKQPPGVDDENDYNSLEEALTT